MNRVELSAYAKINLGLRIIGRRSDGYHDLITVFQRISLADVVSVEMRTETIEYLGPELTRNPADNLCMKAAQAFQNEFGADFGATITLDKRIPVGAGLGGGSSDAAAVLLGMSQIYNIGSQPKRLEILASSLGADIPFFLSGKTAAIGSGKGEILKDTPGLSPEVWVSIVWPGFETSTTQAYRMLDDYLTFDADIVKIILCQFLTYSGGNPTVEMSNDFEKPIFTAHPELVDERDRLLEAGAITAGLCGSGSALFGIFESEAQARAVQKERRSPWLSFVCGPV